MTQPHNEFDASDLVMIHVIYSPADGSPPDTAQYGGAVVGVPPNFIPLPVRGQLFGVNGFSRMVEGQWQWVLQGAINPVDAFVDSLTGQGEWLVTAARDDIRLLCQQLLGLGIPSGTIAGRIPQVYASIAAEIRAEDALV